MLILFSSIITPVHSTGQIESVRISCSNHQIFKSPRTRIIRSRHPVFRYVPVLSPFVCFTPYTLQASSLPESAIANQATITYHFARFGLHHSLGRSANSVKCRTYRAEVKRNASLCYVEAAEVVVVVVD